MKKTLVSALTTALVVGAASTTFAAANPFSDVPADHWAYDAVSQLAADGVIEGYGDSTFRGDRNITRYEMAQMVARAMAKNDVSAANKAMIDKLAAEFADELNNLGVRVSNLERNADMVKWNGKLEYTYTNDRLKNHGNKTTEKNDDLLFRLEPSAEVNEHWHVNARIDGKFDLSEDDSKEDITLKRAWAQGDYKLFTVRFGKFAMYDDDSITDETMSGADLKIGNDNKLSGIVGGGRSKGVFDSGYFGDGDEPGVVDNTTVQDADKTNVFYAGLDYNRAQNKGFFGGLRYYRFTNPKYFVDGKGNDDKNNIWTVKLGYQFDKNSALHASYGKSSLDAISGTKVDKNDRYYNIEFDYKGAQKENPGTWGAWVAYRHLGVAAVPAATWDVIQEGEKGWTVGANYTFMRNIIGTLQYGSGKVIDTDDAKYRSFFGRVEWFF